MAIAAISIHALKNMVHIWHELKWDVSTQVPPGHVPGGQPLGAANPGQLKTGGAAPRGTKQHTYTHKLMLLSQLTKLQHEAALAAMDMACAIN